MLKTVTTIAVALSMALTVEAGGLSTPQGQSDQILIPAAISADGANGTEFRSDIRITNQRDVAQTVLLSWLAQDAEPGPAFVTMVEIEPGQTLASDDFVMNVMQRSGLGAILVQGLDDQGQVDPDARLHATSRVWTPQPDTEGTSSQTFSPIPLRDIVSENLFIIGQRRNLQYRTNVGIVNLDGGPHTFVVTVSGETPTLVPEEYHVTVPANALVQFPIEGAPQEQLRIDVHEEIVEGGPRLTLWTAYASSVDNITGDGWTTVGANREAK